MPPDNFLVTLGLLGGDGSPGLVPGPGLVGVLRRPKDVLLHVATPAGELADNELLGKAGANAFRRADCEISKD